MIIAAGQISKRIKGSTIAVQTNFELELGRPESYSDKNKFTQLESGYASVKQKIAAANTEYEKLFEKIMELEEGA